MMDKAVVLLSGGLDSIVSLAIARENLDVKLALTFDYGQKAYGEELVIAQEIAKAYGMEFMTVNLGFLRGMSEESIWIPNRNALFLNIAGCYCDFFEYRYIVFGANADEAAYFPDNSPEFLECVNNLFDFSTRAKPKVFAPLASLSKVEIVELAIQRNIDISRIKSCYDTYGHCGECRSCMLLKDAISKSGKQELMKIFEWVQP
jgi:7-cyano-7-deazaguanine synthase